MNKEASSAPETPKPVAYDHEGRPLYAHPPTVSPDTTPQVVQMMRPHEPIAPVISEEAKRRHAESSAKFPHLNLSEGEFVISAIKRHPIGLLSIWGVVAFVALLTFIGLPFLAANSGILSSFAGGGVDGTFIAGLGLIMLLLVVLFVLGGIIATIVYNGNRFYLTNESVTQHIQTSLFSRKEQTISLSNIEDASFRQQGIVQTLLNYGSLRLSTEGDETTYRFNYVAQPQRQVTLLNDAVEAFKNGRPVVD